MYLCTKRIWNVMSCKSLPSALFHYSASYSLKKQDTEFTSETVLEVLKAKVKDKEIITENTLNDSKDNSEDKSNNEDKIERTEVMSVKPNTASDFFDLSKLSTELGTDQILSSVIPKPFINRMIVEGEYRKRDTVFRKAINELYMNPFYSASYDWADNWPVSRPFNPHLFPIPLRMGFPQNLCVTPDKYANLELIKIQNFLHLTPPAVKKQCDALKKFCTPFPSELMSNEACETVFPLESHTVDYITSSNTVRDDRARTVTKKVRLCNLVLNEHARKKMIQLLGKERYDRKTGIITIKSERCPMRKQNSDFIDYVLTALYFESWAEEKWETREQMNDYDCYYWWENSDSHKNLKNIFENKSDEEISKLPEVEDYRNAVTSIKLEPEPDTMGEMQTGRAEIIENYKQSVLKLLNLSPLK